MDLTIPSPEVCKGHAGNRYSILDAPDARQNAVVAREQISAMITSLTVQAPNIARFCKAGQFIVVRATTGAERIPLTIADYDRNQGTVTMVVQDVGVSSHQICALQIGDRFQDIVGPLGHASEVKRFGTVVLVGGGLGIAPVYPIQRALKEAGNRIISVCGARNQDLLFWQQRMAQTSDQLHAVTDDGSNGRKGFVTTVLEELIAKGERIDRVIAIGPPIMMRVVAEFTRAHHIPTVVSLNTIMVDGTGMCGGCRVDIGGSTRFTCVDGPEFDGHQVNWDLFLSRMATYREQEQQGRLRAGLPLAPSKDAHPVQLKKSKRRTTRVPMPVQDHHFRATNFEEVALGYTEHMAVVEAERCLNCKKPHCVEGCPVNIDIPGFITRIAQKDFSGAALHLKQFNKLPAVCGRVCPQETQCEQLCVVGKKAEPVAIGRLERFAADWARAHGQADLPVAAEKKSQRVAVIGGGPAGITCAGELASRGYQVTLFEALHTLGGVLMYGIPEFRLPKAIVQNECAALERLGVDVRLSQPIGTAITVPYLLQEGFDAVFIGTGAGLPLFLDIPGENLKNVYSSNEFLTRINLMQAYKQEAGTPVLTGKHTAVVGAGNVAMDAARSALRLGAEKVSIVYRRTRAEMPARLEEIEHALEEGVELLELTAPLEILGDSADCVAGLRCQRMELGEPDASGRRRPVPVEGSEYVLNCDQVVIAIGQGPNPMLTKTWPELQVNKRGNIATDDTLMTSVPGVFAGGDIVTGAATVILAMGAGKQAAAHMDRYLQAHSPLPA